MQKYIFFIYFILSSPFLFGTIKFSANNLIIEIPNIIIASGNAKFTDGELKISSDKFIYYTLSSKAVFKNNISITYLDSILNCNLMTINTLQKTATGNNNVIFNSKNIHATSEMFLMTNYLLGLITLRNKVIVTEDNSKIQTSELIYNTKTNSILSNKRVKLSVE